MAILRGIDEFLIWGLRFFEFCFALVLAGTFGWFHHTATSNGFPSYDQIDVPFAFSLLAMIVCFFSVIAICFLGRTLLWVAAFLDVVIFAGYLASAIIYRGNYAIHDYYNVLRNYLISAREAGGHDSDHIRISALVKLGAALLIIQTIFFFITAILSLLAANSKSNSVEKHRGWGGRRGRVSNV